MRKDEEFITNKKRFHDEFSEKNYEKKEVKSDKLDIISSGQFIFLKLNFPQLMIFFIFQRNMKSYFQEMLMISLESECQSQKRL